MRRLARRVARRARQLQEDWRIQRSEWEIERELERVVTRGRTLVAGPWLSEVGYEVLYWIPFLRWVQAAFRVDPARVVAVSRGGVSSWYEGIAGRYIEMFDEIEPAEYARRNAARGETKQLEPGGLDRDVLAAVTRRLGTDAVDVLHPSLMYRLFGLFWSGHRAMGFMDARTRYARIRPPQVIDPAALPREYVAVKFYEARSLPATPDIRLAVSALVAAIAAHTPVVLLDTGLVLDEHADYDLRGARVTSARALMTPRTNLAVQTQIIAGAQAFVGTCGSLAWLAPMLGVDTSAMLVDTKWLHAHLPVAMRAYHRLGAGRFAVADLRAWDPVKGPAAGAPDRAARSSAS